MVSNMRMSAARVINLALRPLGARITGLAAVFPLAASHEFSMSSLMERVRQQRLPVRTLIDIGASDGKWSAAAMPLFPDANVLALEPLEERRGALERLRHRHPKFDYALCVAGPTDGVGAKLNVTKDLDGSTVAGRATDTPRQVPQRTVDALVEERGLPGPFFIKFDTHGYEEPILRGCVRSLASTSAILMECYNFKLTDTCLRFHEMSSCLEAKGFRALDIADPMRRVHDGAFWQMDVLFLRSDSPVFRYPHFR